MADLTPITVPVVSEPILYFRPSALSAGFTALLPVLSAHIEAERDLAHVDRWDVAFVDWLAEADPFVADEGHGECGSVALGGVHRLSHDAVCGSDPAGDLGLPRGPDRVLVV